jgi:hypothetical protein
MAFASMAGFAGSASAQCVVTADGSGTQCFALLAGQTIGTGSVCVKVEDGVLKVTYTTTGGWELTEAHLWIGNQITDLPQTKTGNPIPGKFPFNSGDITGLTSYTFAIPLGNPFITFSCPGPDITYYMAAHAAVRKSNGDGTYQTETGWSDGSPITSKGNWATFSTFTLTCTCDSGGGVIVCDTAFGKSATASTCFLTAGFERWGWTNGPLGAGTYTFDIWAGAGQCDTNKGTLVGSVTVVYNGTTATVTYTMLSGFTMEETHLYVGNLPYPQMKQGKIYVNTVAPGQYPYIHQQLEGASTDTYTVNITGSIYVIAHAVVCHEEEE